MATIGGNVMTLLDWAKRTNPDGKIAKIVELLSRDNAMLDDAMFKEANNKTTHRATMRTSLPTPAWRLLNQGTAPTKSTTAQQTFGTGILESWSEIDVDSIIGDVKPARLSEALAHYEAMANEMQDTFIYGTAAAPEEFVGLAAYYDNLSDNSAENIVNGGSAGGQTDNMSMWLVGWGDRSCYGIFPEGSQAGIEHEDLGIVTVETTAGVAGTRMRAYQEHWKWKAGLVVEDWRKTVRIANIDKSALIADPTGATVKLLEYMIDATHRQYKPTTVTPVFYCNRVIAKMLDIQAQNKTNVYLTVGMEEGKRKVSFRGIPIRTVDALTDSEARIA
jgi:hypothetical protein